MEKISIIPVARPVDGTVPIPGSKSITNRALLLAALANGRSLLEGALFSDDTHYMSAALRDLGRKVVENAEAATFEVQGHGGTFPRGEAGIFLGDANLSLGNAGTATRFLTAALCLGQGTYIVDGVERMRQRPIGDLLDALRTLGADITSTNGGLPLTIRAKGIRGGKVTVRGDASSQFLSALLQIGPLTQEGLDITIDGPLYSQPYIDMTLRMMRQWGVEVENHEMQRFVVPGTQIYQAQQPYIIEPDASGASYFFAAAAVTGGRVRVENLGQGALQGDVDFVDVLEKMGATVTKANNYVEVQGAAGGVLHGVDVDMNAISDTVMTLAAIAPFADSPVHIRNVEHIRGKETDRISALVAELNRLGVLVDERRDGLTIHPAEELRAAEIETYDDHRMAMSFAITGLRSPGVEILDPGCVAKTFPDFFERLENLCANAR